MRFCFLALLLASPLLATARLSDDYDLSDSSPYYLDTSEYSESSCWYSAGVTRERSNYFCDTANQIHFCDEYGFLTTYMCSDGCFPDASDCVNVGSGFNCMQEYAVYGNYHQLSCYQRDDIGLSPGAIVGIVLGSFVFFLIIVCTIICLCCKGLCAAAKHGQGASTTVTVSNQAAPQNIPMQQVIYAQDPNTMMYQQQPQMMAMQPQMMYQPQGQMMMGGQPQMQVMIDPTTQQMMYAAPPSYGMMADTQPALTAPTSAPYK